MFPNCLLTTNNTGSTARYAAWIDWNNNGSFQASEGLTTTSPAGSTSGTVTFTWTGTFLTNHIATDHTYARIRVTTEAITTANDKNAPFQDGEVEDYFIPFADVSTPLPVKLISFNALADEANISLNWDVADQHNVDYYEVQKSSNGIDFAGAGSVKAAEGKKHYSLTDQNPVSGLNFYKLKSVDFDGRYQYSGNTLRLNFSRGFKQINIYPNPAKKTIIVRSGQSGNLSLMVYNIKGQAVIQKNLSTEITTIDISGLKSGNYYFKVYDGTTILSSETIEILQ
ncbi:MAG: GEVED domain-containing protein [Chitinophagaceae bacterium]